MHIVCTYSCSLGSDALENLSKSIDLLKVPLTMIFYSNAQEKNLKEEKPDLFSKLNLFIAPATMSHSEAKAWTVNTAKALRATMFFDTDEETLLAARALGIASYKYLL